MSEVNKKKKYSLDFREIKFNVMIGAKVKGLKK